MFIDTPPPFVSGTFHLGHYYQYSLIYLLRYYSETFSEEKNTRLNNYQGFDVHGLPLELKCRSENKTKEELLKLYLDKMKNSFHNIYNEDSLKFWATSDKQHENKIKDTISYLLSKKLLYVKDKIVPFCEACNTVLSDQEISKINITKKQYWIFGKLYNKNVFVKDIEVMTTNPYFFNRMCVAFKQVGDSRYPGDNIRILNVTIPLLEENSVDITKGSGLVISCCFSSIKDYELITKHLIDYKEIMNNPLYTQLELQKLILKKEIREGSLTECVSEVHSERTSCNLEINYKETKQLFLDVSYFREYFLKNLEKYSILETKHKSYLLNWCTNLKDWCISRQYKNGTKITLYYDYQYLVDKINTTWKSYTCVLDCWFESALSFLVVKNYYKVPIEKLVRVQGYEISRTWLLYTYIMGYYLDFDMRKMKVLLTGLILNKNGKKFSKSNINENLSFKTIGALRLWTISFLPSKTEKRISLEQIELFQKRAANLRKLVSSAKVLEENKVIPPELEKIILKLKKPLNGIYLEDIIKVSKYLKKESGKNVSEVILKILNPFLSSVIL